MEAKSESLEGFWRNARGLAELFEFKNSDSTISISVQTRSDPSGGGGFKRYAHSAGPISDTLRLGLLVPTKHSDKEQRRVEEGRGMKGQEIDITWR